VTEDPVGIVVRYNENRPAITSLFGSDVGFQAGPVDVTSEDRTDVRHQASASDQRSSPSPTATSNARSISAISA